MFARPPMSAQVMALRTRIVLGWTLGRLVDEPRLGAPRCIPATSP